MYNYIKIEVEENTIKAVLYSDYDTHILAVFSKRFYANNDSYLWGYVNGVNKDKTLNKDKRKEYKSLKAWYNQLANTYFEKLDMRCFYDFNAIEKMFKDILVEPIKEDVKEESFQVGNRSFTSESLAVEYCNSCDFDYNMIVRA